MIGRRLAHYDITAHLGSGAMGEVYQATDAKLGRSVALKFLPEAFAQDPDRVARFTLEAKTLASLNHPAVAAIHGLEEAESRSFLVMELVPGRTLDDLIGGRPLPWNEAVAIARQIAEALAAAHEEGIVHRDLKPGNVKVTPDGRVKVLDFGLAKLVEAEAQAVGGERVELMSTITAPSTRAGLLLGTPAYMAPEQAEGRSVDARADLFAFGCLLYEMLTGRRAFPGRSVAETLSLVLQRDPDWTQVPTDVPPSLVRLLRLCLEKDPRKRRQSAADVRVDLEHVQAEPDAPALSTSGTLRRRSWVSRLAWLALPVAAIAALAVPAVNHLRESPPPEMRLQIVLSPSGPAADYALSPDGRSIVFAGAEPGQPVRLYLRPLDQTDARPLVGTDGAFRPFWSPDSRSLGFFANGQLYRVDLTGGPPRALAQTANPGSGTWGPDGTILFSPDGVSPLFRVSAEGGEATPVTQLDAPRQNSHRQPFFLPDGRRFLFFAAASDPDVQGAYLGHLDGGAPKRLIAADSGAAYLPPDRIVYVQQGALRVQGFDPEREALVGDPVTLAESAATFTVSTTGIVAHRASHDRRTQIAWFDRKGLLLRLLSQSGLNGPELSPDDLRLAGDGAPDGNRDIWVRDLARDTITRFTTDPAQEGYPLWSPDGAWIAFESKRKGTFDIWIKPSSGASAEELLLEQPEHEWPIDWSKDGRFLLYQRATLRGVWDLWALPMTGDDRTPVPVATTRFAEHMGEFSPNGRWVVFDTNESGRSDIVIQAFPQARERLAVSTAGGTEPRWSADGTEIYYVALDGNMMAVPVVVKSSTLELGSPVALFFAGFGRHPFRFEYAVSRDGRFLRNYNVAEEPTPPITIVLNPKL